MAEEEMREDALLKEISLSANEYRLYKLREMTTSKLRNLYQEKLYYNELEICKCIIAVISERGYSL
jgi:hypothetical protein